MGNDVSRLNRGVLRTCLIVAVCASMLGFAMVPLYSIICVHVLGIKGDTNAASSAGLVEDDSRLVTVQFIASVNGELPWTFKPEQTSVEIHPGKLTQVWFDATNHGSDAIVGNAVPSIAPSTASRYLNKTECFCFTEQVLKAGESRRMPVRFFLDPALPRNVGELTLSYTFFTNDAATKRLSETGSPLPAAS